MQAWCKLSFGLELQLLAWLLVALGPRVWLEEGNAILLGRGRRWGCLTTVLSVSSAPLATLSSRTPTDHSTAVMLLTEFRVYCVLRAVQTGFGSEIPAVLLSACWCPVLRWEGKSGVWPVRRAKTLCLQMPLVVPVPEHSSVDPEVLLS